MLAERTIRSLKKLLADIEELRTQVIDADLDKFDKLVNQSRERINSALDSFNSKCNSDMNHAVRCIFCRLYNSEKRGETPHAVVCDVMKEQKKKNNTQ